jgi:membrane-associated phospholipid phosphatase
MILRRESRYVRAPIDKLGYYGLWIRHRLLQYILDGTPILLTLQNHRRPWLTSIMSFFSFLGTEDFFTLLIPLLTWVLDARLGRLFTILLSLGFYIAGFFKCFFCLPRPPVPPVEPLDKEEGDWAFPSNHCTVGVLLPWYLLLYSYLHYDWWPMWARIVFFVTAFVWFAGVTLSRLYLGVHSVADMVAGAIAGLMILVAYVVLDDYIDYQCSVGEYVVPKALILANILLYIHPRTNPETNSYGESVILTGSTVGVVASRSITFSSHGRYSLVQSINDFGELSWTTFVIRSVLRLVIGGSMIIGGRFVLKPFLRNAWEKAYAYLEIPAYSYKDYLKECPPTTKHYTPAYRLPPLPRFDEEEEEDVPSTRPSQIVQSNSYSNDHANSKTMIATSRKKTSLRKIPANDDGKLEAENSSTNSSNGGAVRFRETPEIIDSSWKLKNGKDDTDDSESSSSDGTSEEREQGLLALPYDLDIPSRFMVYAILGWVLGEGAPAVFELIGI